MDITVQGKHIDVGENLRDHVVAKIEGLTDKYFNHTTSATITFSKEGHGHGVFRAHINMMIGKNLTIVVDAENADIYSAFDQAAEKAGKKMRRNKTRIRDHHERTEKTPEAEDLKAKGYILAIEAEEAAATEQDNNEDQPAVIAEMTAYIPTISVSEAVMRLDLGVENAMMFRNSSTQDLNMVYRRSDGNIGWVDPAQSDAKAA
jgi:ribosomal subunit interface protein